MTPDVLQSLREEINSLKNRVTALEFELEDLRKPFNISVIDIKNIPEGWSTEQWLKYANVTNVSGNKRDIEFDV